MRYPKVANRGAAGGGPFPLVVFGHGFAVDPTPYARLLDAWTRSGYVVAAPVFPLENRDAPGGPNEKDLVNQPGDMSLTIAKLIQISATESDPLTGMIDPTRIVVAGQSDGGDTALATAYGPTRDPAVTAAIILSGAEDPFAAPFSMPQAGSPPLLAVQGTSDTINPPDLTYAFFRHAAPPKYLLKLLGAGHQAPYTEPGSSLSVVERATLAFMDSYLKSRPQELAHLASVGSAGPRSELNAAG